MDVQIKKFQASYYVTALKKWVYGHLGLYPYGIVFHENSKDPVMTNELRLKWEEFAVMKKASSSYVFGSITVVDKRNTTHWFSSFSDRSSVFAALNHFLLNSAKQPESAQKIVPETERTKLGTNLLRIAVDSENTLQHGATILAQQGEQIDNSIATMVDLHNDLDVAASVVSGLETWLGKWCMPKKYIHVDPVLLKDKDVPQIFDYEMLYCKIYSKKIHSQKDGVVRIASNGVTILDLRQKILHHFDWSAVSTIRVVSPWEIVVTQNLIGSPDLSFSIVSANMIHVLRKVELFPPGRRKLDYESSVLHRLGDLKEVQQEAPAPSPAKGPSPPRPKESRKGGNSCPVDAALSMTVDSGQAQVTKQKQVISDTEIDQLTSTLSNLKSMALAVQAEEDIQNEKLTHLTDTVERANDKLQVTNQRTKRLL